MRLPICSLLFLLLAQDAAGQQSDTQLRSPLQPGEAVVCYLYHSGWLIRTASRVLIFDYAPGFRGPPSGGMGDGWVDPGEIERFHVVVFVSHAHSDHFDPAILAWRSQLPSVRFVFGWPAEQARTPDVVFTDARETRNVDGIRVLNVHHAFDGIPESAFLVQVDGLTLIHSGDHDHSLGLSEPVFRDNIEYLRENAPDLDLLFIPTFGDEVDAIRLLDPTVVFPMHDGGAERQYGLFAQEVARRGLDVEVWAAPRPGACMVYRRTPRP